MYQGTFYVAKDLLIDNDNSLSKVFENMTVIKKLPTSHLRVVKYLAKSTLFKQPNEHWIIAVDSDKVIAFKENEFNESMIKDSLLFISQSFDEELQESTENKKDDEEIKLVVKNVPKEDDIEIKWASKNPLVAEQQYIILKDDKVKTKQGKKLSKGTIIRDGVEYNYKIETMLKWNWIKKL